MDDLIEEVAMAIADADDGTMVDAKLGWRYCDASMRNDYRTEARAAILRVRAFLETKLVEAQEYAATIDLIDEQLADTKPGTSRAV